jgi:hypothetical protein
MAEFPMNGWQIDGKYVLKELERLNILYEKLDTKIDIINNRLTMLQIKVAGIAAGASIITTLVFLLISTSLKR